MPERTSPRGRTRRGRAPKPVRGRPAGRDSDRTRADILRAARTVLGVHGYRATTLKMVAREAGLSIRAVYYYFGSLQEVYVDVVADTVALLEESVRDVAGEPTLRRQIRAYLAAMHALDFGDRSVMAFMIREYLDAARGTRDGRAKGPLLSGTEHFLAGMVRGAIDRGELAPDTSVRATVGLLSSIFWGIGLYSGFVDEADVMAALCARADEVIASGLVAADAPDGVQSDVA